MTTDCRFESCLYEDRLRLTPDLFDATEPKSCVEMPCFFSGVVKNTFCGEASSSSDSGSSIRQSNADEGSENAGAEKGAGLGGVVLRWSLSSVTTASSAVSAA